MSNIISNTQAIEQRLKELCVNIGERPVGTPNNRKVQSYIGSKFQKHGYEVEYQEFDFIDWKGYAVSLAVTGNLSNVPGPGQVHPGAFRQLPHCLYRSATLNQKFWAWLEFFYHKRHYGTTKMRCAVDRSKRPYAPYPENTTYTSLTSVPALYKKSGEKSAPFSHAIVSISGFTRTALK